MGKLKKDKLTTAKAKPAKKKIATKAKAKKVTAKAKTKKFTDKKLKTSKVTPKAAKKLNSKKEIKRAGASAAGTCAFNISGATPKLVAALDKAAVAKAKKDGHRISRSRLITSVLESKFL